LRAVGHRLDDVIRLVERWIITSTSGGVADCLAQASGGALASALFRSGDEDDRL